MSNTFFRFILTGAMFTVTGSTIFWLAYPLGPLKAIILSDSCVHTVRFLTFRAVVFTAKKGYKVSLTRYLFSAIPISLVGPIGVAIFDDRLERGALTLVLAVMTAGVGFLLSRFVFTLKLFSPRFEK